jgi:uncharacterized spore protein YtfJ
MTDQPRVRSSADENVDALAHLNDGLDRLIGMSADRVFREPVRVGETVVIPAATIAYGGGFGFGTDTVANRGGGGGGWNDGRPVAIIEAGPNGVRIRPVVDYTRIGLTALGALLTVWRVTRRASR